MYTNVNEPIEVATHFKGGAARPLAFRWHGRLFRVKAVNLHHKSRIGRDLLYSYCVTAESNDSFKISFNPNLLTWTLDQIMD